MLAIASISGLSVILTAIIVCAMFFLADLLCCWILSHNNCQSRARHGQLLNFLRSSSMSRTTASFPGYHIRSSLPSFTMGDTSTTPSVSVDSRAAARTRSSTAPVCTSTMISGRTRVASLSWIPLPGPVGPPQLAIQSGLPSLQSQQSTTELRGPSPAKLPVLRLLGPGGTQRLTSRLAPPPDLRKSSWTLRLPEKASTPILSEKKIVPCASIAEYNRLASTCPCSIYSLRVKFWYQSAFL